MSQQSEPCNDYCTDVFVIDILRVASQVESCLAAVPRTVSDLSRSVSDRTASQSSARTGVHHRTLRFGLSSVRQGALLVDEETSGDRWRTSFVHTRNQRRPGLLLDLRLGPRRV